MATLPSAKDLAPVSVQPSQAVSSYRGATGLEGSQARSMMQVSGQMGEISQYLIKAQDDHDRISAEDALNKYRADLLKRRFDEKEGWANKLGEHATNPELIKTQLDGMNTSREQIASTLSQGAKRYFNPQAEASRLHQEASFYGHVSTQRTQQEVSIFKAGVQLGLDDVSRTPLGEQGDIQMQQTIEETGAKTRDFMVRRGMSGEEAVVAANANIGAIVATRVQAALNQDRPDEAYRIYNDNSKLLGQKGRAAIEGKVNDAYKKWEILNLAESVFSDVVNGTEEVLIGVPPGGVEAPGKQAEAIYPTRGDSGSTARGVRNNNPGNLIKTSIPWAGKVKSKDERFESFETPEAGIRALAANLRSYQKQGINTVEKVISRWAPPNENDTKSYIKAVAADLGVAPGAKLDLSDPRVLTKLTNSIIRHENGGNPYTHEAVSTAVAKSASGDATTVEYTPSRALLIQERLPEIHAKIRASYIEKFGDKDPEGLQQALQRADALVSRKIREENGIQRGNLNTITTEILNKRIDNLRDLQAVPGMAEKLSTAGPYMQHIMSLMSMVGRETTDKKITGSGNLHLALTAQVGKGELKDPSELVKHLADPATGKPGLNVPQYKDLIGQINTKQNPDTRYADKKLRSYDKTMIERMKAIAMDQAYQVYKDPSGLSPPSTGHTLTFEALSRWRVDVEEKLRTATTEERKDMLDIRSPNFVGSREALSSAFAEIREELDPVQLWVRPSIEEEEAAPLITSPRVESTKEYRELPAAVKLPDGRWKGGIYQLPDGSIGQKRPTGPASEEEAPDVLPVEKKEVPWLKGVPVPSAEAHGG